ncbi:PLP-dependent transferase [Acidovorax sp. JMULE5]|uniref:PLP-dependent transferase n=1 Tax=Acidovorax sp. JMULE5 TaxID=2518343 RepID=UPI0021026A9E|nr:PLP-dependent transferase [Acidovorax sp. JMULE5]
MHTTTFLVHSGRQTARAAQAINPPLVRASTVVFDTLAAYKHAHHQTVFDSPRYGRSGTSTTFELQRCMAALSGAETCLATASGLAAIVAVHRTSSRSPRGRAAVLAGWDARRGAQWIARLSTSAATPQTARQGRCPKGWSEIGRLDAPAACMGMSPCGASEASTHPDFAPTRSPARSRKGSWPMPGRAATCC